MHKIILLKTIISWEESYAIKMQSIYQDINWANACHLGISFALQIWLTGVTLAINVNI